MSLQLTGITKREQKGDDWGRKSTQADERHQNLQEFEKDEGIAAAKKHTL